VRWKFGGIPGDGQVLGLARARCGANFDNFRGLDSPQGESYLRPIPIHRLSGGAFVRASAFRLEAGPF